MRQNLIQSGERKADGSFIISGDWYRGFIPPNVYFDPDVYLDTSYGFDLFQSESENGMVMGRASASYDLSAFVTSKTGRIEVGTFSILHGTTLISTEHISIGNFVMLSWGSVVCDNFLSSEMTANDRGKIMELTAKSGLREMPFSASSPVHIEDNVWIGFDAVVLPGTRIGRGSVIGSKTVVSGNIPPYSVVVGHPWRIIRQLEPSDVRHPIDPDEMLREIHQKKNS
jgi:acetyltransferase-like isoleucine patch superfamily enzyme